MKVGITFSTFDLFHAGHVKMLEEAKRQCDYLIVGLQLDPSIDRPEKNGPSQSIITTLLLSILKIEMIYYYSIGNIFSSIGLRKFIQNIK